MLTIIRGVVGLVGFAGICLGILGWANDNALFVWVGVALLLLSVLFERGLNQVDPD